MAWDDSWDPGAIAPPFAVSADGQPRRVGVELEFAGLSASDAANVVASTFSGTVIVDGPHDFTIATRLGPFGAKIDSQHVLKKPAREGRSPRMVEAEAALRALLGDIGSLVIPCEITGPPIPFTEIAEIDRLVADLRAAGALGTAVSPVYAFGLHLNMEVASDTAGYLASVIKAFALVGPWLRATLAIDRARRLLPYIQPYPAEYTALITEPRYAPSRERLMADYLEYNPTRSRDLDMLALFAHLDPARVRAAVDDALIKPRPTFHYRLPDCRINEPGWGVARDVRRWWAVERLAADTGQLARMCAAYQGCVASGRLADWPKEVPGWLSPVLV